MNTLQAHKLLSNALDAMHDDNNGTTRATVLILLDLYNNLAATNPNVYRPLKNASDHHSDVWIVPA